MSYYSADEWVTMGYYSADEWVTMGYYRLLWVERYHQ